MAVADALGAPLEFMSRDQIKRTHGFVTEMIGGGWLNVLPGEFTDDTHMTLQVAEGILEDQGNPIPPIGRRFCEWYNSNPKDVGNTIRLAIRAFNECGDWVKAARQSAEHLHGKAAGNGCLMRTLPVTFAYLNRPQQMDHFPAKIARMTHYDDEAELGCRIYNEIARRLSLGEEKEHVLVDLPEIVETLDRELVSREREFILHYDSHAYEGLPTSGYVLHSLVTALWCFDKSKSFEGAVALAVNLGGDADTIGAVCGGLAGTYFGFSSIPERWVTVMQDRERDTAAAGLAELAHSSD